MCDTCGCNVTHGNAHLAEKKNAHGQSAVSVLTDLLSENDRQAAHNRQHFDEHGVLAVNLMSAPGAGKTALLEATIDSLKDELNIAVIEGDLETENDAARIRAKGVPAHQITTGTACHLDAHMVHDALHHMKLDGLDILFRECRQPGVPRQLRPRPAPQRHVAFGHRGRRQTGQVPGDVPRHRPAAADQDRPVAGARRLRPRARGNCPARARQPGTGTAIVGKKPRRACGLVRLAARRSARPAGARRQQGHPAIQADGARLHADGASLRFRAG